MRTVRVGRDRSLPPTYALAPALGEPAVAVWRVDRLPGHELRNAEHAHEFPVLTRRPDGYREAVLAHMMLLRLAVSRLAADLVDDRPVDREPLLAEVFAVIEQRYPERLSLSDVARAVSVSSGHLTTTVRRRTGRTVQEWITERRMLQARRLLARTDLPVSDVGRRVGYPDPGYFARVFGRRHGTSPTRWRGAATVRFPAA